MLRLIGLQLIARTVPRCELRTEVPRSSDPGGNAGFLVNGRRSENYHRRKPSQTICRGPAAEERKGNRVLTTQGALGKAMPSGSTTRQSKYVEVNYRIELVTLTCKSRRLCYTEKKQETPYSSPSMWQWYVMSHPYLERGRC